MSKEMTMFKCPKCKEEISEIQGVNVVADVAYLFSKKIGKYIRYFTLMEADHFICPKCNSLLEFEWFEDHVDENLVAVKPSGLYKPLIIDMQDLPFDVSYAEFADKLPKVIEIDNKEEEEKK